MEFNTKKIKQMMKKYFTLFLIIVFSSIVGVIAFITGTDNNIKLENTVYAVAQENSNEYTLEDIVNMNKVITEKIEVEEEEIPFETVTVGEESRNAKATVLTNGKNGVQKTTYKVRYEDDLVASKVEIDSKVSKKPTNEVVKYETTDNAISRSGQNLTREANVSQEVEGAPVSGYVKAIDMKFTAYCLCKKCTGKSPSDKGYGVTASGYKIIPGQNQKVVAVDPKVIPLGSKVYVQGLNGVPDYGYAIAADKGGAIKGNKIDLYVDEHGSTPWWTVGNVRVYVFE